MNPDLAKERTAEAIIRNLETLRDVPCLGCQQRMDHHQVLMAMALGFQSAPRCLRCLSGALQRGVDELRNSLFAYIQQHECFAEAWAWANRPLGLPRDAMPPGLGTTPPRTE